MEIDTVIQADFLRTSNCMAVQTSPQGTSSNRHEFRQPLAAAVQRLFRRVVVQVLPEPSLDLSHAHLFALAVVGDLIAVDLAEAEIS
jgi:hypothetical protein